jgi:hypothetical protein
VPSRPAAPGDAEADGGGGVDPPEDDPPEDEPPPDDEHATSAGEHVTRASANAPERALSLALVNFPSQSGTDGDGRR